MSIKVAGLATISSRWKFVRETIESLLPQVDRIYVYLDYSGIWTTNLLDDKKITYCARRPDLSIGDAGKFIGAWEQPADSDFYYFSCDDDLVYPETYVEDMLRTYDRFSRNAVISLHGSYFSRFPIRSYYKDKKTIPCLGTVYENHQVMCPGTGAMLFHSSLWRPTPEMFPTANMADIWAGIALQKAHIPALTVSHPAEYLRYQTEIPLSETIWGRESGQDKRQTDIVNQFQEQVGWSYPLLSPAEQEPALRS